MLVLPRVRIAAVRDRIEIHLTPVIRTRGHRIPDFRRRYIRALGSRIPDHFELVQHQSRRVEAKGGVGWFPFDEGQGVADAVFGWGAETGDVGEDLIGLGAWDRGVDRAGVGGVLCPAGQGCAGHIECAGCSGGLGGGVGLWDEDCV